MNWIEIELPRRCDLIIVTWQFEHKLTPSIPLVYIRCPIMMLLMINVLVYCRNLTPSVRRPPFRANPFLFTLGATPFAAQGNRKNPPSVQERKRSPGMYAVYLRKHVEQISCFCTTVCTMPTPN
jgi:hypothetical protein